MIIACYQYSTYKLFKLYMGCGSSNQVHEVGSKNKKSTSTELNQKYMIEK